MPLDTTSILNLPVATSLSGAEYAPVVQGGTTKRAQVSAFDLTGTLPGSAQTANTVLAGPTTGAAAQPTFRAVVNADIAPAGAALTKTDDTNVTLTLGGAPATALVNAVSLTLGWTGQLAVSRGGTGAATASANTAFMGPTSGGAAAPSFRALDALDLVGAISDTRLAKTANYTVANADKGLTIALGGSAYYALTFAAASGYDANFSVRVINEDTGRAKSIVISGGTNFKLYPGQTATIYSQSSAWQVARPTRWTVTGAVTFYVDNAVGQAAANTDGLATGTAAFSTVQAAVNTLCNDLDIVASQVTIQLTSGQTYVENVELKNYVCSGLTATQNEPVIRGDPTSFVTSANYVLNAGAGIGIVAVRVATPWRLLGFTCRGTNSTTGICIEADFGSVIYVSTAMRFTGAQFNMLAVNGAQVEALSSYEIAGNCVVHIISSGSGSQFIHQASNTVTLTGTPAWSSAFISVADCASALMRSITYSGTATGVRWLSDFSAILDTQAGAPGSVSTNNTNLANAGNTNGGYNVMQPADSGGTGLGAFAVGDLLYADTATTLARLADVATGNVLLSGGIGTAPAWGKVSLTAAVSGVLPVANGGTNASSASITAFNNITGYTAAGATGTTSTNLVFSASPTFTGTVLAAAIQTSDQLTVAYNNANFTISSAAGTGFAYFQIIGGSSAGIGRVGVENTTGGALFTGSAASAFTLGSTIDVPVQIFQNNGLLISMDNAIVNVAGNVQCDSFRIDQGASTVGTGVKTISNAADSSTNFGKYFSFDLNGTTVYVPCGTVAPT